MEVKSINTYLSLQMQVAAQGPGYWSAAHCQAATLISAGKMTVPL